MGLFHRKREYEDEVYDPDEIYDLYAESQLFVEAPPLCDTTITVCPRDIYSLDTDAVLERAQELPYELRYYLDMRRAFSKALESCREQIVGFESYEGGRTASYSSGFEYDGRRIKVDFTLSRESNRSGFVFTAYVRVNDPPRLR